VVILSSNGRRSVLVLGCPVFFGAALRPLFTLPVALELWPTLGLRKDAFVSTGVERSAIAKQRLRTPAETATDDVALKIHTWSRSTRRYTCFTILIFSGSIPSLQCFFFFPSCVTLSTTPFLILASHANTLFGCSVDGITSLTHVLSTFRPCHSLPQQREHNTVCPLHSRAPTLVPP
jgi:hypothetical protein